MGGVARGHEWKALAVGGAEDHAHILLSLPASIAVSNAIRVIKSSSSRWMHEECGCEVFAWQEGFGAFSIGRSQVEATIAYISGQLEHHRKRDFRAEFMAFLAKHQVAYDPRHVLG